MYKWRPFCWIRHLRLGFVFTLQLSFSTTRYKCTTAGTWSGGTQLCSSARYRVSSGNTSLSHLGSRTPSSIYTRLQRAVSCYCGTQFSANITSSIILFIRRQLVRKAPQPSTTGNIPAHTLRCDCQFSLLGDCVLSSFRSRQPLNMYHIASLITDRNSTKPAVILQAFCNKIWLVPYWNRGEAKHLF
jgi:hypothetical protein